MRATERSDDDPWRLFRCRKIPSPTLSSSKEDPDPINNSNPPHRPPPAVAVRFLIVIEICSPTEFSVTPQPLNGFTFPGGLECFRELKHAVPFREIESQGIRMTMACNIKDHELLLRCLRMISGVELQDIPPRMLSVAKRLEIDYVRDDDGYDRIGGSIQFITIMKRFE
ncbi:uncharacterized protein A4U43_C01F320 [Asparagus officinalis]|uniref:Uncharacterized protein n=1 Tax=Asparagus officinalis TaxID=4686 RepID=A0A5P1FQC0_ASPOF|nr:uncharacterized protein A4U43_C01F320 [Asparagus officinalis]